MLRNLFDRLRWAWQDWQRGKVTEDNFVPRLRQWWER